MNELRGIKILLGKIRYIFTPSQKRGIIAVFIMSVIGALMETLGVSIILPLVQGMLQPEKLMEISVINQVVEELGVTTYSGLLLLVAASVIIIYLIKNVYLCFLSYVRVKFSTKIQREISVYLMNAYVDRGYNFFRKKNTGELLRGIGGAVAGLYQVVFTFMKLVAEVLTIVCIFVYVVITDYVMALSMILLTGMCLVIILFIFKKIAQNAGQLYFKNVAEVNKWALQFFSGVKEILVLNRENYFLDRYKNSYEQQQKGEVRHTVAIETPAYVIEGICITGIILAVCVRVSIIDNPAEYVPQLAAFAVAAFRLLPSIGRISANINTCIFNVPAVNEVYENIIVAKGMTTKEVLENEYELQNFKECLRIENITWKYPDGEQNVLENVSLDIKKGEAVAFIGPSGAGKSTLADIILGLFRPNEGRILFDEVDILGRDIDLSKVVGFVPQSVYLIDDTIRRNVAFGIADESIDEKEVWRALEQAQIKDFILSLPDGLDTVVGERGIRFSGGQTQRLAIARALYTDPDILILDEATSALDGETERAVIDAINALQGMVTMIIIAHRITTIKNCDKIYEVNEGHLIERNYEELV